MANSKPIRMRVDDREPPALAEALRQRGVRVEVVRLEKGDVELGEGGRGPLLIVERKTLADLVSSIQDGRLFRQVGALVASGRPCVLLLEGWYGELEMGMSPEALRGALLCLAVIYGIPVIRSRSTEDSAWLLLRAGEQLRRVGIPCAHRSGAGPTRLRKAQTYVLLGLPGVGRMLALRLLAHFGSVEAVMSADARALMDVQGIGRKKADRIREVPGVGK